MSFIESLKEDGLLTEADPLPPEKPAEPEEEPLSFEEPAGEEEDARLTPEAEAALPDEILEVLDPGARPKEENSPEEAQKTSEN